MILSDAEAIRAGWANLASYRHALRVQAQREAERDTAREQAEHMASRRNQQSSIGTLVYVPGTPNLGD